MVGTDGERVGEEWLVRSSPDQKDFLLECRRTRKGGTEGVMVEQTREVVEQEKSGIPKHG